MVCGKHNSCLEAEAPPLYEILDIETRRAESAPPVYRPRDDWDLYKGCDVASAFWHARPWVLAFRGEDRDMRHALEHRSQDGMHVDDEQLDGPHGWRTLQRYGLCCNLICPKDTFWMPRLHSVHGFQVG